MIKRRFYKLEHGDGDAPSSSSSSSSSAFSEKEEEDEEGEEGGAREAEEHYDGDSEDDGNDDDGDGKGSGAPEESGPQSGYESEESSGDQIDCEPSGVTMNEDEDNADGRNRWATVLDEGSEERIVKAEAAPTSLASSFSTTSPSQAQFLDRIVRFKSVFKCKLCPRIVCLSEQTMRAHLKSKRHARSEKLFKEGRLRLMLNDDGEIEEEAETHAERYARTVAVAQNAGDPKKKKNKGRQRQRNRLRKKKLMKKGTEEVKGARKQKRQKTAD